MGGTVVGPGDPAGNETTLIRVTDKETEAQRGHTARKGQSLEVVLALVLPMFLQGPGPPQAMPLAGVERPSDRAGLWEPKAESGSGQPGQSWSEQGHRWWGWALPEFSKPSPTQVSPRAQVQLKATRPGQDVGIPRQRGA